MMDNPYNQKTLIYFGRLLDVLMEDERSVYSCISGTFPPRTAFTTGQAVLVYRDNDDRVHVIGFLYENIANYIVPTDIAIAKIRLEGVLSRLTKEGSEILTLYGKDLDSDGYLYKR